MEIRFDGTQEYQLAAIEAVAGVFAGQGVGSDAGLSFGDGLLESLVYGNRLRLDDAAIVANVQGVQEANGLPVSADMGDGMHFSVEMETGTGKTYVYLRTMYELFSRYGWSKFVIVVPSVAIRAGVDTTLRLTRRHLEELYPGVRADSFEYQSKRLSQVRGFAQNTNLQIMVMNIDSFNRDTVIMRQSSDSLNGLTPLSLVAATNPVVIVDEPQNMEGANATKALASLNPLCTLRYSATHKVAYHKVYRLSPYDAYELGLVKRIEVDAVLEENDFNRPFIALESVKSVGTRFTAKATIEQAQATAIVKKSVALAKNGDDLYAISGNRDVYRGYVVSEINAGGQFVQFENGVCLEVGQTQATDKDAVMREQIRQTVRRHLERERLILRDLPEGKRLKVLSLFFIDRVANYAPADGKIRRWFEEAYTAEAQKPMYRDLGLPEVSRVHNGYFAQERTGAAKDSQDTGGAGGKSADDDRAYQLIMRDKERLLSREEPLRFIFSHSALREGWDNPNVFQICTLNESQSATRKRQEIGRGLRLPVDESGERVFDTDINRLTVIANEHYKSFADALQKELKEDGNADDKPVPVANARERKTAKLRVGWETMPEFLELWEAVKQRTRYRVEYATSDLIRDAAEKLRERAVVTAPRIVTYGVELGITAAGIKTRATRVSQAPGRYVTADGIERVAPLPDVLGYLQRDTGLTRGTLFAILQASGKLPELLVNPQQFLDGARTALRQVRQDYMVKGIVYEPVPGSFWEMRLFEDKEISGTTDKMVELANGLYDYAVVDSDTERKFAQEMSGRDDVPLLLKLPDWFKIETPLGTYNPDWAIVKQTLGETTRLRMVRETKSELEYGKLRPSEVEKIKCGRRHFAALHTDFEVATEARQV